MRKKYNNFNLCFKYIPMLSKVAFLPFGVEIPRILNEDWKYPVLSKVKIFS